MRLLSFRLLDIFALAAATPIVIGIVWLILWLSGVSQGWAGEGAITVKTNMALAQVLGGLSLLLLGSPDASPIRRRLGLALATIIFFVGTVTLSQHVFDYNAGIDQLLATEPPGAAATVSPNRMGPPGSCSLALLGAGLLLLASRQSRFAPWLGLATCVINLVPAVGFLYGIAEFYSNPQLTGIAWSTVIALLSLGAGLMLARPAEGPAAQLLREDLGGVLLRRLVPSVILIPLVLGFLRVQGEQRGFYDVATGTGMLTILLVVGFLFILWRTAAKLSRTAEAKAKVEAALRESEGRERVAQAVEAERRRLNDVLNLMPAYVVLLSPDYRVPFANRFFEERFGQSKGGRCYEYLFGRTAPCERCETFQVLKTNSPHEWEWAGPDGRTYEIHDFPFTDVDGSPLILEVGLDITARKRAQDALERATEILRAISDNSPDLVFAKDCGGRVVFASESTLRVLGKTAAEVLGKTDMEIHADPRLGEAVMLNDRKVRETRQTLVVEEPTRSPDGTLRVFHSTKVPWIARDGTLADTFGIAVDITRLKQAEAGLKEANETLEQRVAERTVDLRESEERLRLAWRATREVLWDWDIAADAQRWSAASAEVFGWTDAIEAPQTLAWWTERVHPEDRLRVTESLHRAVDDPTLQQWQDEYRFLRQDGSIASVLDRGFIVRDASGRARRMVGAMLDITERKLAEEALEAARQSIERERNLLQAVMNGASNSHLVYLDREFNFVCVNETYARSCGYAPREMIGLNHFVLYPHAENEEIFKRVRDTGQPASFHDKPFEFPDNPERGVTYWDWTLNPVHSTAGKVQGLILSLFETTERKRAEEEVRNTALFPQENPSPVLRAGRDGRLLFANRAASELLVEWQCEVGGRAPEFVVSAIGQALEAGTAQEFEMGVGERRLSFVLMPIGERNYVNFYGRDITEQKLAEEALRESEERFRTMADGTPVPIWITDARGGNRFVNRAYCQYFGVAAGAVQGNLWQPLVHPEDLKPYMDAVRDALRERKAFRTQARVRRQDGAWRWIESYAEPRFTASGEFLGMAGSIIDITERREFQAELERLVAERTAKLQELVGELEHFSYTITHDLKSPLRAMRGFAELASELSEQGAQNEAKEFLGRISTAAERMDALIRDALNYSRAVRQELPLEDVDSGALLRGMLDSYPEFQPSKAGIRVEGRLPVVLGNQAGLTQCLSNLLGNAVKFVKPGEVPDIRVWAEERDEWARIWVEDKGIGISREMLPRVFDMFSRGSKDYEGTGIGLALVRKVTQRMGGRSGAESEEGKGSRFWVELKCGEGKPSSEKVARAVAAGKAGMVLYVEDEANDALFMERAFARKGLKSSLRVVRDGRAAIEYLSGAGKYGDRQDYPLPAVVLLDLNLPEVPGFEVLKWMRNHPDFAATPVVVFSSSTREDDRLKAQALGAHEFMTKPKSGVDFSAVLEELQAQWLGRSPAVSPGATEAKDR